MGASTVTAYDAQGKVIAVGTADRPLTSFEEESAHRVVTSTGKVLKDRTGPVSR